MTSGERYGDWIQTWSGHRFFLFDPRPEDVDIFDIAHALANVCRFGGHCKLFYSVAQHSLHVASMVPPELELEALLHDAAEAYLGDMVRPLKHMPEMAAYRLAEERVNSAIAARFGLSTSDPHGHIKHADNVLLATERRDLFDSVLPWSNLPEPHSGLVVVPRTREHVFHSFMERFGTLTSRRERAEAIRGE